jgi:hypothetical protein
MAEPVRVVLCEVDKRFLDRKNHGIDCIVPVFSMGSMPELEKEMKQLTLGRIAYGKQELEKGQSGVQ